MKFHISQKFIQPAIIMILLQRPFKHLKQLVYTLSSSGIKMFMLIFITGICRL